MESRLGFKESQSLARLDSVAQRYTAGIWQWKLGVQAWLDPRYLKKMAKAPPAEKPDTVTELGSIIPENPPGQYQIVKGSMLGRYFIIAVTKLCNQGGKY